MYPEPLLGAGMRTIMMGQTKVSSLGVKIESTSTLHQHSGCHSAAGRDREERALNGHRRKQGDAMGDYSIETD
jgi:hypothetical protein